MDEAGAIHVPPLGGRIKYSQQQHLTMSQPKITASLLKDVAASNQALKAKGALTIIAAEDEQTLPLDLLLVLDVSGSMSGAGVSVLSDSTVHILNNMMRPEDRIAIITFNSSASVHTSWTDVNGTVSPFSASGGTNFGSAINEVLSFLGSQDQQGNRAGVALFLSDGHGTKASDDNVKSIPDFGFTMHTIGVTSGAKPDHLEHMAELAKGFYYDAPTFNDVKSAFQSIFNYGKTIVYAAPDLEVHVKDGVSLDQLTQTPQGLALAGNLGPGNHTVSLSHMVKDTRMEVSFDVSVDNIADGMNSLATFSLQGATAVLNVRGTTDETELYNAPINTDVTLIAHSADAATAIKRGDDVGATRAITKMEKLAKTNPNAATRTTILTDATHATTVGEKMETLGRMQSDTSGKTKLRED